MKYRIKTDDNVIILAGKHRSETGAVRAVKGDYVTIKGLNLGKKHVKAQESSKSTIQEIEKPIHISNVSLCNSAGKRIRLKTSRENGVVSRFYMEDGKKVEFKK